MKLVSRKRSKNCLILFHNIVYNRKWIHILASHALDLGEFWDTDQFWKYAKKTVTACQLFFVCFATSVCSWRFWHWRKNELETAPLILKSSKCFSQVTIFHRKVFRAETDVEITKNNPRVNLNFIQQLAVFKNWNTII